jgi:o-succinylbenzoate---CoA ligase
MSGRLVAIDLPGGPAFVDALRRVWDAGDAALPIDQRLPPAARAGLLGEMRPAALVGPDGVEVPLPDSFPVQPGDALVVATSGTTGDSKGVVHTHTSVRASAEMISRRLGVDASRDKWYACLPPAHIGGLSVITRAIVTDTPLLAADAITADGLADAVEANCTLVSLVVAALPRIDAERWRVILLGGSATPPVLPATAIRTYGMTETGSGVVYDGWALDGVGVRAIDGELQLRTPTLARSYRLADAGPEGRPLPLAGDGWFVTGDGGAVASDGLVSVTGRIGDVIVTGGEKVWPEPVERVLAALAGIADVAVVGVLDPHWGHAVTAIVVPVDRSDVLTLDVCRAAVKAVLPAYCAPVAMVVADSIPRTAIGKIRRSALHALT